MADGLYDPIATTDTQPKYTMMEYIEACKKYLRSFRPEDAVDMAFHNALDTYERLIRLRGQYGDIL